MRKLIAVLLIGIGLGYGADQIANSWTFQLFGQIISSGDTARPVVALTFDDGPTAAHTSTLLAALDEGGARATFFLMGEAIAANPEAAQAIADAGHEIGNHSWDHPRMVLMSPSAVRRQLEDTDAQIRGLDYNDPLLFRPPYGKKLVVLPWVLDRMERTTATWSMAPEWDIPPEASADDLTAAVVETAKAGDIILLHGMNEGNQRTRDALPGIIEGLRARGFEFATVSELLAARS